MDLLKDLLKIQASKIIKEDNHDDHDDDHDNEEDADMQDLVDKWMDANKVHHFESMSGVRNLGKLVNALGYHDFDYFLEDNPGAMQAIVEWITSQDVQDWKDHLRSQIHDE